jgi:hypothetical protein
MPNNSSAFALVQGDDYCKPLRKPCVLPPGAKPLCYANKNTTDPNGDQFCGYIQNGFLYAAKGCCTPPCPSENCPNVPKRPPTGTIPFKVELSPELVKEQTVAVQQESGNLPKLVKLMLILLSMLVVSALLLSL